MRSQKPIKLKRSSDHSRWIMPVICVGLTLSVSLVIALAWQNLSADTMGPAPEGTWPEQVMGPSSPVSSEAEPAIAPLTQSTPEEPEPEKISDYYGVIFPQRDRVTSDYFSDAVFIGDSLTIGIKLYDIMSDTTVFAATGFNLQYAATAQIVDTPEGGKISVIDALARGDYKKIYIMMGANGVGFLNNDQTLKLYGEFIDEVKAVCPNSIIYVQSILPINETKYAQRYEAVMTNADIDLINESLVKLAGEKHCLYLDVASAFKDENGHMPENATPDGLHLYSQGYTTWFDYLKTHAYEQKEV